MSIVNKILVIGWLNVKKHDIDRVLFPGGLVRTFKATDYKNPVFIMKKKRRENNGESC